MVLYLRNLETTVGSLYLVATDLGLRGVHWVEPKLPLASVKAGSPAASHLEKARDQIEGYLAGQRFDFDLELDLRGSCFQLKVWTVLKTIPYGHTLSYQQVAQRVASKNAVRAVGMANKRNPLPIIVPCHRVIHTSGEIGGYAGGVENKAALLRFEKSRLHETRGIRPPVERQLRAL